MEKGYEDIYSDTPYVKVDHGSETSKCAYIDLLYVPPELRGQGIGRKLALDAIKELPKNKERIRLKSCALGSGHTKEFWMSLGFKQAYYGETGGSWWGNAEEIEDILVLGINGYPTPGPEKLYKDNNSDREMFESPADVKWIEKQSSDLSYQN